MRPRQRAPRMRRRRRPGALPALSRFNEAEATRASDAVTLQAPVLEGNPGAFSSNILPDRTAGAVPTVRISQRCQRASPPQHVTMIRAGTGERPSRSPSNYDGETLPYQISTRKRHQNICVTVARPSCREGDVSRLPPLRQMGSIRSGHRLHVEKAMEGSDAKPRRNGGRSPCVSAVPVPATTKWLGPTSPVLIADSTTESATMETKRLHDARVHFLRRDPAAFVRRQWKRNGSMMSRARAAPIAALDKSRDRDRAVVISIPRAFQGRMPRPGTQRTGQRQTGQRLRSGIRF